MQNHIAVADADAKLAAYLGGFEFKELAHHEDPRRVLGQVMQTDLENIPESVLAQDFLGVTPSPGACLGTLVGIGLEGGLEGLVQPRLHLA